jgi:hypothetical protein
MVIFMELSEINNHLLDPLFCELFANSVNVTMPLIEIIMQNAANPALVWRRLPVIRRRRIAVLIGQMARRQLGERPEAPGRPGHEPCDPAAGQDHRSSP